MLDEGMTNYCIYRYFQANYFRIGELPAEYRFLGAGAEFVEETKVTSADAVRSQTLWHNSRVRLILRTLDWI